MNDFTKEELQEYISMRRNAINSLINVGIAPGILDGIEMIKLYGKLEELEGMEEWFNV